MVVAGNDGRCSSKGVKGRQSGSIYYACSSERMERAPKDDFQRKLQAQRNDFPNEARYWRPDEDAGKELVRSDGVTCRVNDLAIVLPGNSCPQSTVGRAKPWRPSG